MVKRILWAEDEAPNFNSYAATLRAYLLENGGVTVEIKRAENGDAVFRELTLARQANTRFDALVVDVLMPGWNGIDTVRTLSREYPGLPMIVVSSKTKEPLIAAALADLLANRMILGYYASEDRAAWCVTVMSAITRIAPSVLHLSDLHFGDFHAFPEDVRLEDVMRPALERIRQDEVNLILVTGDTSSRAMRAEFDRGVEFLHWLTAAVGLGLDRLVIVPGNHDILRAEQQRHRFANFMHFLTELYRPAPTKDAIYLRWPEIYDADRGCLGRQAGASADALYSTAVFDDISTVVVGLNSVVTDEPWNYGQIASRQLIRASEVLNGLTSSRANYLRIAMFHHQLFAVPTFRGEDDSARLIRNQGIILRHLIETRFRLIFHGHTHYSATYGFRAYFVDTTPADSDLITVVATGSLGGVYLTPPQFCFQLTTVRLIGSEADQQATVRRLRLEDDSFSWKEAPLLRLGLSASATTV